MFSKSVKSHDHKAPKKMRRSKDRRVFSDTASKTDSINAGTTRRPMRGGIRL